MLVILFICSILIGLSIGMIGMGGVFLTPTLILLLELPISTAMGTSLATFIGTGLLGSYIYHQEGNINWSAALLLGSTSIIGAIIGSQLNLAISEKVLQSILAIFLALVGLSILSREKFPILNSNYSSQLTTKLNKVTFSLLGVSVGITSGLLGVGGPVLLVPILVLLGWPMLTAVGVSQVVSVFAAVSGTTNYLLADNVKIRLAILLLTGELIGVLNGGYLAHRLNNKYLKLILSCSLIGLSIYFL
ncbi:sulfite exporter TauE/SafE family protein [Natroniella sulfidigena]|uniref:sulfite exporter TauE/SafE family protein n=1 Tax=Natroniella sulfidigena TaxID=723921 RepID=UPI00200AA06C|nr:sulfite exporter TauE/SafE family protein [Natroniella sulfidigena]MCK8817936.1 sulfite exporter TauE/SafE family protein [Natroniella sulfidigena]